MKDIAIYGAGGFGRETALLIEQINLRSPEWNLVGFFDDGMKPGASVGSYSVLGGKEDLSKRRGLHVAIAISDPLVRKSVSLQLPSDINFPSLIHPMCQPGDKNNSFGKGNILTAGVILTTGIVFGEFVIINLLSTVGHDVTIGSFSTIMPGCSISGSVHLGECTMMGTGARILQNLSVGNHCKIGAGAVITQNFSHEKTIIGIPAHEK